MSRIRQFAVAVALAVATAISGSAQSAVVLVTSAAGLGANDSIDWGQIGPSGTVFFGPQNATSGLGLVATVDSTGNHFTRYDQPTTWAGNFANGTRVIYHDGGPGPETLITFASPIFGAGAQVQSAVYGAFTARVQVFDAGNNLLGSFTENGVSNGNSDGSAIFIGALSDVANISSIRFDLTAAVDGLNLLGIGPLSLNENLNAPIPEPGTAGLLALGSLVLLAARRRKRN